MITRDYGSAEYQTNFDLNPSSEESIEDQHEMKADNSLKTSLENNIQNSHYLNQETIYEPTNLYDRSEEQDGFSEELADNISYEQFAEHVGEKHPDLNEYIHKNSSYETSAEIVDHSTDKKENKLMVGPFETISDNFDQEIAEIYNSVQRNEDEIVLEHAENDQIVLPELNLYKQKKVSPEIVPETPNVYEEEGEDDSVQKIASFYGNQSHDNNYNQSEPNSEENNIETEVLEVKDNNQVPVEQKQINSKVPKDGFEPPLPIDDTLTESLTVLEQFLQEQKEAMDLGTEHNEDFDVNHSSNDTNHYVQEMAAITASVGTEGEIIGQSEASEDVSGKSWITATQNLEQSDEKIFTPTSGICLF